MPVSVTGVEATLRAQRKITLKTAGNIALSLEQAAHVLLRASQKLVPVDTRLLVGTGKVVTTGKGFGARASVSYDTPYAIYVHEDLTKFHAPPTQAKFLSGAVPKVRGTITALVKRNVVVGMST